MAGLSRSRSCFRRARRSSARWRGSRGRFGRRCATTPQFTVGFTPVFTVGLTPQPRIDPPMPAVHSRPFAVGIRTWCSPQHGGCSTLCAVDSHRALATARGLLGPLCRVSALKALPPAPPLVAAASCE
eukprot:3688002-Prymnesium_polylepis.1